MAPMAKFKRAPFSISLRLDIDTVFTKDKPWRKEMFKNRKYVFIFIKTCQQTKYSVNYPQGPQPTSIITCICYKVYDNIQAIILS